MATHYSRSDRPGYHICLVLIVWLPMTLSGCLVGAARELMHHPLILLLPDGLRRFRNYTVISVALVSGAFAGVFALAGAPISPWAAFGLVAGMLAVPCVIRRSGFLWQGTIFLGWAFLLYLAGAGILGPSLAEYPLEFFFGGVAVAALSIMDGFSPRLLRTRIETPFRAPQSVFWGAPARGALQKFYGRGPRGRDWAPLAIAGSTWSWMCALKHCTAGRRRHGSLFYWVTWVVLPTGVCALVLPTFSRLNGDLSVGKYWATLAHLASLSPAPKPPGMDDGVNDLVWAVFPLFAGILSFVATPRPAIVVPISRERLARALFGLGLVKSANTWLATTIPIFAISLFGQCMSGRFLPGLGLPMLAAFAGSVIVLMQVLLNFVFLARRIAGPIVQSFPGIFVVMFFIVLLAPIVWLGIQRDRWLPYVLTPLGVAALVVVGAASVALLWRNLRRHYLTCDLVVAGQT
ncbi:MAG TPA: hypothetical protein VGL42_00975 [Opitutaceae bacterium]